MISVLLTGSNFGTTPYIVVSDVAGAVQIVRRAYDESPDQTTVWVDVVIAPGAPNELALFTLYPQYSNFANGFVSGSPSGGDGSAQIQDPVSANPVIAPTIMFNGQDATGTTQTVTVGQQIALTGVIPSTQTSNYGSQTWSTPGGNAIGGATYTTTGFNLPALPSTSGTNATNSGSNYTFYWASTGSSYQITYTYTTQYGTQSPPATVTFNVQGPTNVTMFTCTMNITSPSAVGGCTSNGPLGAVQVVGSNLGLGANALAMPGIIYTASTASSPMGSLSFLQLLNAYNATYNQTSGGPCYYSPQLGLDLGGYPIRGYTNASNTNLSTDDNPHVPLFADDTEVTVSFNATMYVFWTSNRSNAIPVPLGSLTWRWNGDATHNVANNTWALNPNGTNLGSADLFMPSNAYPPAWITSFSTGTPCQ